MGSIEKRARDGKITWLARWRDPGGRQRKRSFPRKLDAERYLTSIESGKLAGAYVDPAAGQLTLGRCAALWLERQVQLRPSTRARYGEIIRVHVEPTLGSVPLAKLERSMITAWVAELSESGLAGATVRHVHRVLHMILASAVADGRIVRNVASGVPLPRAKGRGKRFLTHEQVAALAEATGEYGAVVRVLAYCGLRFGELAALRVAEVDLLRRRIKVSASVTEVNGRLVFGEPKSSHARLVPFPRSLVDDLAHACAGKRPDDLVFTAPEGGVLWLRNFRRRVFDPAARVAGLDGLTPHELRHTAASLAVSAGANVKAVQRMLGHASAAMTLDVYSGLFDDDLDTVADRLDRAATEAAVPRVCPQGTMTPITVRDMQH
jgi:integrase